MQVAPMLNLIFWILDVFAFSVERESMKGMLNGIIIGIFAQLTGYLVFITYAGHIFKQVGASQIDPNVSSIAIAVMMLCGTLCTTRFSDTLGRKALLIISLAGSAFGLLVFALYSYLQQNKYDLSGFEWVPVTSLSFCIFISSSGVVALIFVCVVENLPTKVFTFKTIQWFVGKNESINDLFAMFLIKDSNCWVSHLQYSLEHHGVHLSQNVPDSNGVNWPSRMLADSGNRESTGRRLCSYCNQRNKRTGIG